MQFQRLRLSGFKSFVDPTELRIEPGLTGIVGPNGCGKSNLLEALRWVMGANSAKAMRGAGMDDVIFGGSATRPARNRAEVSLTIDNEAGLAPAAFRTQPVLEVVRRIDRGAGSAYRINGKEALARHVQLLFADASTGANSPALVRQGQISELIAARPQNRRLVLEEAAGVAGLHGRRHEAELKVRATEVNLQRLDDLARELDANLGRLRREARQAERYRRLADEIRRLQALLLHARWLEARTAFVDIEAQSQAAEAEVERRARLAAGANAAALATEAALRPLRDEQAAAAAVTHRLEIESDRIERALEGAAAELSRLQGDLGRLAADAAREGQIVEDAGRALSRIETEIAAVAAEDATGPTREPELLAAAEAAGARRRTADLEVERLAGEAAAAEAGRRAAEARVEEARGRLMRTRGALDQARAEHRQLADGALEDQRLAAQRAAAEHAEARLSEARTAVEAAESRRAEALADERRTRLAAREETDRLAALRAEAKGLKALTTDPSGRRSPPALDQVAARAGHEAALAAALGDDLAASLDPAESAHWAGSAPHATEWPPGVEPLADCVQAPPQLAARLAFIGVASAEDGARLAPCLRPGQRLVSLAGDLWRWDGLTVRATAPRAAEARLRQRSRLTELERQIDVLGPACAETEAAASATAARLAEAESTLARVRGAPRPLEAELAQGRQKLEILEREAARREARCASLADTVARVESETAELTGQLAEAERALAAIPRQRIDTDALARARASAQTARAEESASRAAHELERRERDGRRRRLQALGADRADWTARARLAGGRQDELVVERGRTQDRLAEARAAPEQLQARRRDLLDELARAAERRARSSDLLAQAEAARGEADRAWRAAESEAGEARERRASLAERLGAARDRFAGAAAEIRGRLGEEPEALGRRLEAERDARVASAGQTEARLATLEREREQLGPVNLGADAAADELAVRLAAIRVERADLAAALTKLRQGIDELNAAGRERLLTAFEAIDGHFRALFTALFEGGQAELRLVESDDPLEAGLEIFACPPGKRLTVMSLMSGGEQALTAAALIFAVFLANPAPICVLDEVDAPLDDANVDRFCDLLDEMRRRAPTRFIAITHNPLTMSRMDRLYGVTMPERGVSRLVSVDLRQAEALAAQ